MSFFKKLFGQLEKDNGMNEKLLNYEFPIAKTEQELIEIYGGLGFEKQADFAVVNAENNSWNFDMNSGTISFGNLVFPVQILGTISHSSESWLWSWENHKSGIPDTLKQQAYILKQYGEANSIDLLKNATFDASINDVHLIGCIASGMMNSSCYYIADYGQGAMLVTITDTVFDKVEKIDQHRILTTFPQLISSFDMNHKKAFKHYIIAKGYDILETSDTIVGKKKQDLLNATFDEYDRLTNLRA